MVDLVRAFDLATYHEAIKELVNQSAAESDDGVVEVAQQPPSFKPQGAAASGGRVMSRVDLVVRWDP